MRAHLALRGSVAALAIAAASPAHGQATATPAPATSQDAAAPPAVPTGAAQAAGTATGAPPAAAGAPDGSQLGDVIVTAERRSTDVQHTALAITALSGDLLTKGGATNAASLVAAVPGLAITSNIPIQNVYIRGVGGGITNNYGDPAVSYNVDNVYIQRPFGGPSGTYYDLDRVEVLKGPQGTLYGRNATVGAVNVISKAPTFDGFHVDAGAEVGNYGDIQSNAAVNVPLSDTVSTRFAMKTNNHEGYLSNGYNDASTFGGRASILFKPIPDLSIKLVGDYFHDTSKGPQTIFIYQANDSQKFTVPSNPWFGSQLPPCGNALLCPTMPSTYLSPANQLPVGGYDGYISNVVSSAKGQVDWNLGPATLTVIPAFVDTKADYRFYSGGFTSNTYYLSHQYSAETRLASNGGGPFKWVAGAFFYAERMRARNDFYQPQGFIFFGVPHQKDTSYAFFGQGTYSLTQRLRVTGGVRYTHEQKSQDGYSLLVNVPPPTCLAAGGKLYPGPEIPPRCQVPNSGSTNEGNVSWKGGVEFDAGQRSLLFANVSTGFKAGGLYLGLPPNSYRPEHLTAYQIGSKNRFFDNKLQLNLEGFYWDYKDQQIYTFANVNPAGFANYPINEDGYVKGVEGELVVLPTRNDRFSVDVVYEDGKFTNYYNPGATLFVPPATVITVVPKSTLTNIDRPALPNWNGSASYQHTFRLASSATVVFNAGVHFESGAWFDLTHRPNSYRDAYAMADTSLTYNAPGGHWSVSAFVNNVANAAVLYGGSVLTYAKSTAYTPPNPNAWTVSIYPPRTFGGRVNFSF